MTMNKRWTLVNRKTGKTVRAFATRAAARLGKEGTVNKFRIYDTVTGSYVR